MVPIPQTSLARAAVGAPQRNYASTGNVLFKSRRRALVTYGKKDTKPLPLTAKHFISSDPYSIPPDEDGTASVHDYDRNKPSSAQAAPKACAAEEDEAESGLSDEPGDASEDDAAGSASVLLHHSAGASDGRPIVLSSTAIAKPSAKASKIPKTSALTHMDIRPSPKRAKRCPKDAVSKQINTRAIPHLPVNELVLVPSPIDQVHSGSPQSSRPGIQTQDPIINQSSSQRPQQWPSSDVEDRSAETRPQKKQPLSAFRTRLRSNKLRYKSVSDLRKRTAYQSPNTSASSSSKSGDGFDSAELFVSPLARKSVRQKRRPRRDTLVSGFSALQLQSGPLPDVKFEVASSPLKVEVKHASPRNYEGTKVSQRATRCVSFNDPTREQDIMAELSSISAPPVPQPVSDESDEGDDDEDDDDVEIVDEDVIADGFQAINEDNGIEGKNDAEIVQDDVYEADTEPDIDVNPGQDRSVRNVPEECPSSRRRILQHPTASEGVSLDFRQRIPGQPPRRRIRQDTLMEVNDNIVEVPASDTIFNHLPRHLEVEHQHHAPPTPETEPPPRSNLKRPRSILKNASQTVLDSTSREHTAANTRRNSTIQLSESRYFTDAADMLRTADPSRHKIVPRRKSNYFSDDVEMLDSGAVVPETSPSHEPGAGAEMLDCTTTSDLAVLRRDPEAEWTSQSLPGPPRDLWTLTRSVSKGYGTLSQSARRKPSLPFQSPTKIR